MRSLTAISLLFSIFMVTACGDKNEGNPVAVPITQEPIIPGPGQVPPPTPTHHSGLFGQLLCPLPGFIQQQLQVPGLNLDQLRNEVMARGQYIGGTPPRYRMLNVQFYVQQNIQNQPFFGRHFGYESYVNDTQLPGNPQLYRYQFQDYCNQGANPQLNPIDDKYLDVMIPKFINFPSGSVTWKDTYDPVLNLPIVDIYNVIPHFIVSADYGLYGVRATIQERVTIENRPYIEHGNGRVYADSALPAFLSEYNALGQEWDEVKLFMDPQGLITIIFQAINQQEETLQIGVITYSPIL
jgi:hypothetical protein